MTIPSALGLIRPKDAATARLLRPAPYRRRHLLSVVAFLVVAAVVGPALVTTRPDQYLLNLWLVYSIAVLGFYWMFTLGGRFAFCQTFMMALGGYTSAAITRSWGEEAFLAGLFGAVAVTALLAGIVGAAVRKAQAFYFAIATMAVAQVGTVVFHRTPEFSGPSGQQIGITPASVFGRTFLLDADVYWLFLGVLGGCLVLAALLERSPVRREAIAARDNSLVASLSGVPVVRVQLGMFVAGSALGGLSGALIGHWQGAIATDSFGVDLTIGMLLMLLLGGANSMWGPLIGAAIYVSLPRLLVDVQEYSAIVYGLLLLLVVLAMPQGIAHAGQQCWRWTVSRVRRREEVSDAES